MSTSLHTSSSFSPPETGSPELGTSLSRCQKVVAAGFIYRHNRVLLAQRALTKRIAPGAYHLPGGHVEFDEDPAVALQRELREELGVTFAIGEPFATFSYRIGAAHTVGIAYLVCADDTPAELTYDRTDTERLVWAGVDELPLYLRPTDHNLAIAKKAFAQHLNPSTQHGTL